MADNAKQVEQDVRALTNALKAFSDATGGAAGKYSIFIDILKRMEAVGIAGFAPIKAATGDLESMTRLVRSLGEQFEVSKSQIDGMVASLEKLSDAGRIQFSKSKNPLTNVTGGAKKDVSPFADFVSAPEFENSVLGGARALETVNKALDRMNVDRFRKMKFEMGDLNNISEDAARKITKWSFEIKESDQPIRRATIVTDALGKQLKSTSRQFRSFGAGVARDIVEVTKWSIAIAIVYAPMKKITDLMREAVQIEAKLADVQVALVNSTVSLQRVWEESAKVARQLGVSVEGVVDGYVLATRATANIPNPTERASATVAVLRDSMLLAKLAGIDQAIALDTLVGALRQLKQPLTEGGELLDKWVAVSKAANVSIGTLAESFAITATAAGNVGISIDKLNGIIAAVAEVTTLSATESGNAVRAFISGFQKDRSERELTRFGISIRQVNGELRSFTEIIEDIVSRREVGLISDRELAKLSEIIGGGARRGPQVNAILENYGRVNELAAVSAEANGDAAEALSIKMDTLQTASTNLNNAFTELAAALGGDAGFLDGAQDTVKVLTGVVDAFTSVVQILGKATPALIAFTAAFVALRYSVRLQDLLGQNLAQFAGRIPLAGSFLENQAINRGGTAGLQSIGSRLSGFFGRAGGGVGGAAIGLGVSALSGQPLADTPKDARRTGATIGAGVIGTIIAGGNPIGGVIGAAIVQATYSNFVDKETDLVGVFTRIFTDSFTSGATAGNAAEIEANRKADREKELFGLIGQDLLGLFQVEDIGRIKAGFLAVIGELDITPDEATISNYAIAVAELASGEFGAQTAIESYFEFIFGIGLSTEDKTRIAEIIDEMQEEGRAAAGREAPEREGTPFARAIVQTQEANVGIGGNVFQVRRRELVQEVGRGEAGVRELRDLEALGQLFDNQLDTIYTGLILGARSTAIAYEEAAVIIIKASEEERKGILDLAGDVGVLFNVLQELGKAGAPRLLIAEKTGELSAQQRRLGETIALTGQSQVFKAFQQPDLIDIAGEATPAVIKQLEEIVEAARQESNEFLESLTQDDAERAKVISTWGELGFLMVEAWEVGLQGIEGVMPRILEQMIEDAGLAADEISKLSIQTPDITGAEFQQAVQERLPGINELIKSVRREAGFAEEDLLDIDQLGFIFKDNVTDVIHADQLAIQLLLRDIKELNEDQLEGIFNIPEGVTALIPFTGQLFFSDQPISREVGEGFALGTDIEAQTDTLAQHLQNIEGAITGTLGLVPGEVPQIGDIDFEQLGRDFDAFKQQELIDNIDFEQLGGDFDAFKAAERDFDAFKAAVIKQLQAIEVVPPPNDTKPTFAEWIDQTGIGALFNQLVDIVAPSSIGKFPGETQEPVPVRFDGEEISRDDPRFEDAQRLQQLQELQGLLEIQQTAEAAQTETNRPFGDTTDFWTGVLDFFAEALAPFQSAEATGPNGIDPRSITGTLGLENLGNVTEAFEAALPQSIPVTINTKITNPVSVLVDGRLLQQFIEERSFQDLGSATRRAGALGYVQE